MTIHKNERRTQDDGGYYETYLGFSQVVHLLADWGFTNAQRPHVQLSLLTVGAFIPAAPQLKPTTGGAGAATGAGDGVLVVAPLRGFSQVWHWEAEAGFERAQSEQVQESLLTVGGFKPAAPQLKPVVGGCGAAGGAVLGAVPLRGFSHVWHWEAEVGFDKAQSEQVQVSLPTDGTFIPAAAKSNPLTGAPDVEASPKVKDDALLVILLGKGTTGLTGLGGLGLKTYVGLLLTWDGSKPNENATGTPQLKVNDGREVFNRTLASFCAFISTGTTEVLSKDMLNVGKDDTANARTWVFIDSVTEFSVSFVSVLRGSGWDLGLVALSSTLKLKLNPADGGVNLKSLFGREGGVVWGRDTGAAGAGDGGVEEASAWKLNLSLLGSFGMELGLKPGPEKELLDDVGLLADPLPLWLMFVFTFGSSLLFSPSGSCIETSSLSSSTVTSGVVCEVAVANTTEDGSPIPVTEGFDFFVGLLASSSSAGSSTT